jgi:ribosome biogenesis GTPase A
VFLKLFVACKLAVNISRTTPPAQRLSSRVFAAARDTQDETDTPVSVTEETEGDDYVKRISITSNDYPEVTFLGEIELPDPENARVKSAEYVSSAVRLDQLPKAKLGETKRPEIAVIGRSNVGKSSLINMLTRKAGLAMVSKTPGE